MSLSWQKSFHAAKAVRWAAFAYIRKRGMIATVYVTKNFGFRRGEIYFADLDPHYGSEQGGKRPVIVIQNNTGNKFAPTVIVAAVTSKVSKKPNQPTHVLIEQNPAYRTSRPDVAAARSDLVCREERKDHADRYLRPDRVFSPER